MSYLVLRITSRLMLAVALLLLFYASSALAVLRDTELENALRVYMQPLLKAVNLQNEKLSVVIIADPDINAAILPGGRIIVHSGLLSKADDPTEVAGVLAHELGHYINNDLLKLSEASNNVASTTFAGATLGLGLALLTQSGDPLIAGSLLGSHMGVRNHLQFTRSMETAADRRATEILHRSGIGLGGITKLNQRLLDLYPDPGNSDAKYLSTHPLTQDRIAYFAAQLQRLGARDIPVGWQEIHDRVRAKLRGFLDEPQNVLQRYREDETTLPAQMARAIALMRLARYAESLALMEQILQSHPEDGFLHDLMGDISRHAGQSEQAIAYYSRALERLPWASLIRYQRAELWLKKKTPTTALAARDDLLQALRYEPEVPGYWRSLAEAHAQLGEPAKADLAKAEAAIVSHRIAVAHGFAQRAKREFPRGSADWLRADDILKQVEAERQRP